MKKIIVGAPITISFSKKESAVDKYTVLKNIGYANYQIDAVKFFDANKGKAINADDMGLGKTAEDIGYGIVNKEIKPILIICPSQLKINWGREIEKWTHDTNFEIIEGVTPYKLSSCRWYIINYDILFDHRKTVIRRTAKRTIKELHGWFETFQKMPLKLIIIDECHYLGNSKSDRTKAVKSLYKKLKNCGIIPTSGSPILKRPLQFFPVLNLTAPNVFPSEWKYKMDFCDPTHNGFGWQFKGASNVKRLARLIKPIMIRRMKSDAGIMDELPPIRRILTPVEPDLSMLKKYNIRRDKLIGKVDILNKKQFDLEYSQIKKIAYEMKLKGVMVWIDDYIANGAKFIVFLHHVAPIEALEKHFGASCTSIYGKHSAKQKQKNADKFNDDPSCKLCIFQIKSAVGLNMVSAAAVGFLEFGDSSLEHCQAEDRIHRKGQRADKLFAFYFVTEGTDDIPMMNMLEREDKTVHKILSDNVKGKFFNGQVQDFNDGLIELYKKRKNKHK